MMILLTVWMYKLGVISEERSKIEIKPLLSAIKKGKEVYLYSAILSSISKRSDMDHTVLPANYTMSAFPS